MSYTKKARKKLERKFGWKKLISQVNYIADIDIKSIKI